MSKFRSSELQSVQPFINDVGDDKTDVGRSAGQVEVTDLKVTAKVKIISMKMANDFRDIGVFYIKGITAGYIMKASHSKANVHLGSIKIKDLNKTSIYKNVSLSCTHRAFLFTTTSILL